MKIFSVFHKLEIAG